MLEMHTLQRNPYERVAEELGITVANVMVVSHRARRKMMEHLEGASPCAAKRRAAFRDLCALISASGDFYHEATTERPRGWLQGGR